MKKYILFFALILLMNLNSFAQGFTNYKALITDDSGAILANQAVSVRFTIFDNDPSSIGVQVFQETHATTTDTNGIIVLNIGESNAVDWFAMDWSVPTHYLKTEYDTNSGFVDMGTQAFRTVPYSQYAFKSQYSIYAQQANEVDFSNITNVPTGLSDGDDDTQLTEAEVDNFVANNGYLTTEVDGDTTNELQTISKTGSTIILSDGGGSITDDNTQLTETEVDDFVANNGYLTTATLPDQTDVDFLKSGTTDLPTSIYDGIYHLGRMAIGKYNIDSNGAIELKNSSFMHSIYSENNWSSSSIAGNNLYLNNICDGAFAFIGVDNTIEGTSNGYVYGMINNMYLTNSNALNIGVVNSLQNTGTGDRIGVQNTVYHGTGISKGVYNRITNSSAQDSYGVYNSMEGGNSGNHFGTYSKLTGSNTGMQFGSNILIDNTGDGAHFGNYSELTGTGSGSHYGISNNLNGNGTGEQYGVFNDINTSNNNLQYGTFNLMSASGSGEHFGTYNSLSDGASGKLYGTKNYINSTQDNEHFGSYSELISASGGSFQYGFYANLSNFGNGDSYGLQTRLTGTGNGNQFAISNAIQNTSNSVHYGNYSELTGTGSGSHYGSYNKLDGGAGDDFAYYSELSGLGDGDQYGLYNKITNTGIGKNYGVFNEMTSSGYGLYNEMTAGYGLYNNITGNTTGQIYGVYTRNENNGGGIHYGNVNNLFGSGTGAQIGVSNNIDNSGTDGSTNHIGVENNITGTGYGKHIGIHNVLTGNNTYQHYGVDNYLVSDTSSKQIGVNSYLSGSGNGDKLGIFAEVDENAGGQHYAIYGKAKKSGAYAGYFQGDVKIARSSTNALVTIQSYHGDADLHIKSTNNANPGVHYYLDDTFKTSTGYSVSNDAYFVYHNGNTYFKNGNILPDGHKTRDLGANGNAWDDVYADNFVNQGAAAFTDRSVTNEIITHPPIAKKDGDFDAQTKDGLYELNPDSLPNALRTKNGIKIDEIATYNYKANYEQQVLINKQQSEIEALKTLINKQQTLLKQLVKEVQTLKQK